VMILNELSVILKEPGHSEPFFKFILFLLS
jgi:hypothetical protein